MSDAPPPAATTAAAPSNNDDRAQSPPSSSQHQDPNPPEQQQQQQPPRPRRMPTAVFLIGMAGTGKSTLTQRINHFVLGDTSETTGSSGGNKVDGAGDDDDDEPIDSAAAAAVFGRPAQQQGTTAGTAAAAAATAASEDDAQQQQSNNNKKRSYFINFDPAVLDVPFAASIDIRDTITQREVMQRMRLGPNGAILTALNIFATRINEVLQLIESRADELDYVFIDTPGQIEVFTWSASGQMITEAFAATMPTVMLFIADTVRCANPQTFMSTMLYSCSVMYKSQLPLCVVFNKCDVTDGSRVTRWLDDETGSEELSAALRQQRTFAATLSDSLGLFMNEYYKNIAHVCVSAMEGTGMRELFRAIDAARNTFETEYQPLLEARQQAQLRARQDRARADAAMLARDAAGDQQQQQQTTGAAASSSSGTTTMRVPVLGGGGSNQNQ